MSSHRWKGRHSRCCVPRDSPLTWLEWVDDTHESVIALTDWIQSLHPSRQNEIVSRIEALCGKAARGELVVGDVWIEPIVSDPVMYELRWTLFTKVVRQYHAEPDEYPNHLVKLHLHIKADTARREASSRSQQEEIEWAIERYNKS